MYFDITTEQAGRMVEYLHQIMLDHLCEHQCFSHGEIRGCDEYEALYALQLKWSLRAARLEMMP